MTDIPPLDDLHRLQEDNVQKAIATSKDTKAKIAEAKNVKRNITEGKKGMNPETADSMKQLAIHSLLSAIIMIGASFGVLWMGDGYLDKKFLEQATVMAKDRATAIAAVTRDIEDFRKEISAILTWKNADEAYHRSNELWRFGMEQITQDRLTGTDFVEIQDSLEDKNGGTWIGLSAKEIREIQGRRNP